MKRVQITIEVEVPDGAKWVAVDEGGAVDAFKRKPTMHPTFHDWGGKDMLEILLPCRITNWRDTLTEVQAYDGGEG